MKFFNQKKTKLKSGFTLIEVIIASAIISVTLFAIMTAAQKGIVLSYSSLKNIQANFLLEEGAEAVKIIRDNDFNNISAGTKSLCFDQLNITWKFSYSGCSNVETIDGFTREVVISDVLRDLTTDDIVNSVDSSYLDSKSKKVVVTVSWVNFGQTQSKSLSFYVMDIFN